MTAIRVRPGLHYAPVDGGVYVSSARASFVMSGPAVLFRVVDTCVPLLEDGTDIDGLVAGVGTEAARPLVEHLVKTLDARGLILRPDQLHGDRPDPSERERFAEALAYLETHKAQPYADFRRVRAAHVLVAGPPEALGPAIRGLLRAGVGRVTAATWEPARLAGLAARHPEVSIVAWSEGAALPAVSDSPDAAVICSGDEFPELLVGALPPGCVTIPVRLGKDVAVVGPAVGTGDRRADIAARWRRAASWCQGDGGELRVRPSSDLLAGALAGQVAFDGLVGLNPGRMHVLHGADLSADAVALAPADGDWRSRLSAPWSGLFRLSVPGDLPQLPLALTLAEGRTPWFDGRTVGFGPDQDASTSEAALDAVRRYCDGRIRSAQPGGLSDQCFAADGLPDQCFAADGLPQRWVAAAGLDERDWRLDGALRLLARQPGDETAVDWLGIDDMEGRRRWRALEEYELVPVRVSVRRPAHFAWVAAAVYDRRDGQLLGEGWGPGAGPAAATALSSALAVQQARRGLPGGAAGTGPGLHHRIHGSQRDRLAGAVGDWLAATGLRLGSRRLASDPVAGALDAWCGPVWIDD